MIRVLFNLFIFVVVFSASFNIIYASELKLSGFLPQFKYKAIYIFDPPLENGKLCIEADGNCYQISIRNYKKIKKGNYRFEFVFPDRAPHWYPYGNILFDLDKKYSKIFDGYSKNWE